MPRCRCGRLHRSARPSLATYLAISSWLEEESRKRREWQKAEVARTWPQSLAESIKYVVEYGLPGELPCFHLELLVFQT